MTRDEVLALHPGDEVFWNDPDDAACSTYYSIQAIEVFGGDPDDPIVRIRDTSGAVVECFASELS